MNSETNLDNRLRLCAEYVRRGSRPADIGTDHAYLPVWLCRNGVCPSAIAADINPDPLSRGRLTVENSSLSEKIELRLSNGLSAISADEADDIVIAGMGGELIAKIIESCGWAKSPDKHFILQPMTKSEALICYLCQNSFKIESQECCEAGGKCYTVLSVYYTGELHPLENETHLRYLSGSIARLRKQALGEARFGVLADRLEEFCGKG